MRFLLLLALFGIGSVSAAEPVDGKDLVMLEAIGASGPCTESGFLESEFVQHLPDGSSAPFPSTSIPPKGKLLVVTDVDWQLAGGTPNSTHVLRLFVVNKANHDSFRALESKIQLDPLGAGATTTSVTSGIAISEAAALCLDVVSVGGSDTGTLQHVLVRGRYTSR